MRNAFARKMEELAAGDERIVLLSGDIGNRMFDAFKEAHPARFINCGVAESNMMSMAAGLALSGLRPVVYTIAPFVTYRCLEQIRIDVCYQNLPVVIVGVGAGLSYAALNATHHALEDIAVLRALPRLRIVCPGDPVEVKLALQQALADSSPVYLRLGKKGEPVVHRSEPTFQIGIWNTIQVGEAVCLLATGTMLPVALQAAKKLATQGIPAEVVSCHTVKPLDEAMLTAVFSRFELVVSIEEHSRIGGFGSAVAEWLCDQAFCIAQLVRLGTDDRFLYRAGGQNHARTEFGLTPERIAQSVFQAFHLITESGSVEVVS
jgi:transketolase